MAFVPKAGLRVGGKYILEARVGAGGMGTVWAARHEQLGARSAIKLMTVQAEEIPGTLARFEREARATALLKSPHVVRVHDYGLEDETPYMVMELLDGEDLADRLKRVRALSLPEAKTLATGVAKGLRVAHAAGIIHRDIKPRNIFFATEDGEEIVKLVDFGIARETKRTLVDERTATGVVVGSPHHMSPEQATCGEVDARSDLWSLGVVLYHALTGTRPFEGGSMSAILLAVVSAPLPRASLRSPTLAPEVDAFFDKALCRDPAGRFQSADEMAAAFQSLPPLAETTAPAPEPISITAAPSPLSRDEATLAELSATPPVEPVAAPPPRARSRWALGALALLLLATASVAVFAFRSSGDASPLAAAPPLASVQTTSASADPPALPGPPKAVETASSTAAVAPSARPASRPPGKAPPKEAAAAKEGSADHCKKRDPEYGVCLQW